MTSAAPRRLAKFERTGESHFWLILVRRLVGPSLSRHLSASTVPTMKVLSSIAAAALALWWTPGGATPTPTPEPEGTRDCARSAQRKASELVDMDDKFGWCHVDAMLEARKDWYDPSVTYTVALYGSPNWRATGATYTTSIYLTQRIAYIAVSLVGNARVLWFHWTTPAHPKFTLDPFNRLALKIHVISGSINVILPLFVFFVVGEALGRLLALIVVAVELAHCATAARMLPHVFGARVLMTPGYGTCVVVKFAMAICVALAFGRDAAPYKDNVEWLWAYWAVHNTYAWVRVWYVLLIFLCVEEHRYTISILLAGMICVGQAVGFWAVVILLMFLGLFQLKQMAGQKRLRAAVAAGTIPDDEAYFRAKMGAGAWIEHARSPVVGPPGTPTHALALRLVDKYAIDLTTDGVDVAKYDDDTQGGCIFDVIDANSDGDLDVDELVDFLVSFSCGTDEIVALLSRLPRDADGGYHVTREYFVRYFAPFWRFLFPAYVQAIRRRLIVTNARGGFEEIHAKAVDNIKATAGGGCPFAAALAGRIDRAYDPVRHKPRLSLGKEAAQSMATALADAIDVGAHAIHLGDAGGHATRALEGVEGHVDHTGHLGMPLQLRMMIEKKERAKKKTFRGRLLRLISSARSSGSSVGPAPRGA